MLVIRGIFIIATILFNPNLIANPNIELSGIIFDSNPKNSVAFIRIESNSKVVKAGYRLASNMKIKEIRPRLLVVENDAGDEQYLSASGWEGSSSRHADPTRQIQPQSVAHSGGESLRVHGDQIFLSREMRQSFSGTNWQSLSNEVSFSSVQGGKGAKIDVIDQYSMLAKMDLRKGDVIRSVNGQKISGRESLFSQLRSLQDSTQSHIDIVIERNGSAVIKVINFGS